MVVSEVALESGYFDGGLGYAKIFVEAALELQSLEEHLFLKLLIDLIQLVSIIQL